jgi:enoyl-[acyl-carrier protein] reductase III
VVVGYMNADEAAAETGAAITGHGRRALLVRGNVADAATVRRLTEAAGELGGGRLDVLVHAAALGAFKPTMELRRSQFDLSMSVNARALLELVQEARPLLRGRDARVLALSSRGAGRVLPSYGAVGVSKAALEALARYLAVELAAEGVRVNVLTAGLVDTDAIRAFPDRERRVAEATARTPFGRIATPADIAPVAAFLCGPDAAWITGQVIVADGGLGLL